MLHLPSHPHIQVALSIGTDIDGSISDVHLDKSNDPVISVNGGSRLDSTLVDRLVISVLDGNTSLADGTIDPILDGSEAVLLDASNDLYELNNSVLDGSKLASVLVYE